ncbi:MAG TPA: hypothetical protein VG477_12395 [Thermoanaerobaculia bacterium]|nr:hypothetical protein [Thermoanaerobaculia bacterium]
MSSKNDLERLREELPAELDHCKDELTDDELDDVSGGEDGWGTPPPPDPKATGGG